MNPYPLKKKGGKLTIVNKNDNLASDFLVLEININAKKLLLVISIIYVTFASC
jgi:hypothetical protein